MIPETYDDAYADYGPVVNVEFIAWLLIAILISYAVNKWLYRNDTNE